MTVFVLPDLGEGLHDAEIVAWLVAVGAHVVVDQPLVQVETDKAVLDIPSPQAGRIAQLHGAPGDRIETGAPLVEFADGPAADAGAVAGTLPTSPALAASVPTPSTRPRVQASPAVRALARRLGVDLAAVAATGPGGTITSEDVERAGSAAAHDRFEPLRGPRLAMARNMARAGAETVPATVSDDADIDRWRPHEDTTVRLLRAVAAGCLAAPALNAWLEPGRLARRVHDHFDVAIAVESEDGLFTPVVRNVRGRSADALRTEVERLEQAARARTLRPEELRDATIALSNFGTFGGRYAAMVVPPPLVAILGAGRALPRVVVRDGAPAVRRQLPLSLTFDHRAATGGEAATFLAAAIKDLELPD
jgi:pyruvate dehydrogenase E2 component (dihydrolipoamide acetyltransferase)